MVLLQFFLGVLIGILLYRAWSLVGVFSAYKKVETALLLGAVRLVQYKYHAIKLIEIAYMEEVASHPEKKKELDQIVGTIHKKFDSYGDFFITEMVRDLPYKTVYSDWKTAIQHAERLITKANYETPTSDIDKSGRGN